MAEGGEVSHFCDRKQSHEVGCEYFADGGTMEEPLHVDPTHSIAAYLAHEGLHGLLKLHENVTEDSLDRYNKSVKHGHRHIEKKIEHLFEGKPFENEDHTRSKKHLHDWIEKGGITHDLQSELHGHEPEEFAEGGEVKKKSKVLHEHPVAHAYPEQNMLLQMAKGRASHYLNDLKPQKDAPKLTFDRKADDRAQIKSYQKALHIAAHPLSVLEEVQKGTLEPEHMYHLKNLHPEVHDAVHRKTTEKIIEHQLAGKKPSYKVRQGLGLMMGAPMSSEMTPQHMQSIQSVFHGKQSQEQPPTKNKKGTSALTKVDDAYLTNEQAREVRQQRQKT